MFTAQEYQAALERIRDRITPKQIAILQALCDAPNACLSAAELSRQMEIPISTQSGYYGRFAHLLGDALGYMPKVRHNGSNKWWPLILRADVGKDGSGSYFLTLHPTLVQALHAFGIVSVTRFDFPDELVAPVRYPEGARKQITVNAYERNPKARQACIARHKSICSACGFDFFKKYGDIGKDYIQVHHLTPLSKITEQYEVDPVEDLLPFCANCHVMLHQKDPPYTLQEMRDIIEQQAKKRDACS